MVTSYHRPTKAIIHTKAITENVSKQLSLLEKDCELFAVVKANGYGHGAVQTAKAAKEGGASGFCVATIDEALELRGAGFDEPILILGIVTIHDLPLISEQRLSIPVATLEWLEEATAFLQTVSISQPISLHVKVDTGMGRIGFLTPDEVLSAVQLIEENPVWEWEGIFTHYSTADFADDSYWRLQNQRFKEVLDALPHYPRYIHDSNSATALWHKGSLGKVGNMIRFGIAMYGLNPSGGDLSETFPLNPALELVSELVQVKLLEKESGIGYGETYITSKAEWIGTVPIGYADGWLRKMQGFFLLVDGEYCEIVGRVCMDQLMIRLPKAYPAGIKVTLIGKNGDKEITMQDVADYLNTIHYEVACTLSERVPREYKR